MKSLRRRDWLLALLVGSLINITLFLFLPSVGKGQRGAMPNIISVSFAQLEPLPRPAPAKPKPKPTPKSKPKPKVKPKPKPKPVPSPLPASKPLEEPEPEPVGEETAPQQAARPQPLDPSGSRSGLVPVPVPLFQLTASPYFQLKGKLVYPDAMKAAGKRAVVKVEVIIDEEGRVRQARVIKSAGEAFDEAALSAAWDSVFHPAQVGERKVASRFRYEVEFGIR